MKFLKIVRYDGYYLYNRRTLTGIALIVAWLPDIVNSLFAGRSLELIEVYTTSVTYVLDMGVIAPAALILIKSKESHSEEVN